MFKIIQSSSQEPIGVQLGKEFSLKIGRMIVPPFHVIGFIRNKALEAIFLFNDYTGSNIEIHAWAPGTITRLKWRFILNYVFNELKCNRLSVKFMPTDTRLKKILPRLGFVYEANLRYYYGPSRDNDALVYYVDCEQAGKWITING